MTEVLGIGFVFSCGAIFGFLVAAFFAGMVERLEWSERKDIDRRLKKLERHLCCGKGVFGCDGGPDCKWDHK